MSFPLPANEAARLAALHATGLLDTADERDFDDMAQLAAHIFKAPYAAVSFVDADRQWFKARVGLPTCQTARGDAFCAHAVLDPNAVFVVPDASLDARFSNSPLVTQKPNIRFYAGAPLVTRDGLAIGILCVKDSVPRQPEPGQLEALTRLARQVMNLVETRRLVVELAEQKAAVDHHALVAIADPAGRLTYVNDRLCALTRYDRAALLDPALAVTERAHPAGVFLGPAWETIKRGEVWAGQVAGHTRDGETYWLHATVMPLRGPDGRPRQYIAIATDITALKRTKAALREGERCHRQILEALPVAVYTVDMEGRLTSFNRACVEFSGRVPEMGSDGWKRDWKLLRVDGTPLPHEETALARTLREGCPIRDVESIVELPDGSRRHLLPFPTPLRDSTGRMIGAVNMFVDITDRKRHEETLRLLGSALQQAREAVVITDTGAEEGGPRIIFANTAFSAMTGYPHDETLGRQLGLLWGPLTDKQSLIAMREQLRSGYQGEAHGIIYRKDGSTVEAQWQCAPVRAPDGRIAHLVGVLHDVTERRKVDAELRRSREAALESVRLKSRFLANMSHELRTPLNTINGVSATLLEQDLPAALRQSIGLIHQCGDALLQNIQTILTHSSLESAKLTVAAEAFSPTEVVRTALRITGSKAREKGLILDHYSDPSAPTLVIGDAFRLQQVLVNLLANAIKFTEAGSVGLRFRCRTLPDGRRELRFTVGDTGVGIAPEDVSRLFTPFSQVDNSQTRRFEGTGLGLAISKSLVELMGGRIEVRSRAGIGSIFRFTLPVAAAPGAKSVAAATFRIPLAGRRLLIVEPRSLRRRQLLDLTRAWGLLPTVCPAAVAPTLPPSNFDLAISRVAGPAAPGTALALPTVWLCNEATQPPEGPGRTTRVADPCLPQELIAAFASLLSAPAPSATAPAGEKLGARLPLRILGVDDIATNRDMLRFMCRHLGYETDLLGSGAEALQRLETHAYDLVLLDVNMPELDGLAVVREICRRQPDPARRPKLIAVTANVLAGDRERCLAAGVDAYLGKPLLPRSLADCLEKLFLGGTPPAPAQLPPPTAEMPWIDTDQLREMTEGLTGAEARTLLHELQHSGTRDCRALYPRIAAACAARRAEELASLVHGLKGCALSMAWKRMGARCLDVMGALRAQRFEAWDTLAAELQALGEGSVVEWKRLAADFVPAGADVVTLEEPGVPAFGL